MGGKMNGLTAFLIWADFAMRFDIWLISEITEKFLGVLVKITGYNSDAQ